MRSVFATSIRLCAAGTVLAVVATYMTMTAPVMAAGGLTPILAALQSGDAFVSPTLIHEGKATSGDAARLQAQATAAVHAGVPQKFAVLSSFPGTAASAASALRKDLNYSGVLIITGPPGIGIASGSQLTSSQRQAIAQAVAADCLTKSLSTCALEAGQRVQAQYKSNQSATQHNAAVFWGIVLVVFAVIILGLIFAALRGRTIARGRTEELQRAVSNTLSLADDAVQEIESTIATKPPSSEVRAAYDQALALRDRARNEMEGGTSQVELTQANQDAAQAVLALRAVMQQLGIESPLTNPLEDTERRCFYCGRTDRPPYSEGTISDGKGNSMQIWVCRVDQERLAQGKTPQIATVAYNGAQVPWWAVPNTPYYYSYGGPSWQYWLPFIIGMDVGGWFGGGWANPGWYGGVPDVDDGGWVGGDDGGAAAATAPTDAGGVDFGGWDNSGGDSSGWDSSGGSWDSGGGWDSGGDSGGGWDSGSGDSGGWS